MLKKLILAFIVFALVVSSGLSYLKLTEIQEFQGNLLTPPKTYFTSTRTISAAILSQKDTKVPEVNRRNLTHAAITLITNLKSDQTYDKIIVIPDPRLPQEDPDAFMAQIQNDFPNSEYATLQVTADENETEIYEKLQAASKENTLLILHTYLNYTDQHPELVELQKLHYRNAFNNLSKASLGNIAFTNSEALKAVYQIAKEANSRKSLPTLEDSTYEYQIKYIAEGHPLPTNTATITFFGDIMLGRYVRTLMDRSTLDYPFENMDSTYLQMNDLLIANLEGPVAEKAVQTSKAIAFRFMPDIIPILKKYKFDVVSMANNHALDMGQQGLEDSYRLLPEGGIAVFGHPRDLSDISVSKQEVNGRKIALLGLNDTDYKLNKEIVAAKIKELTVQEYQVIPFIHWGNEYIHTPSQRQVDFAHSFVDAGAITVVGMHPHVVQSIEIYNEAPIFYSLGNAIFDQYFSKDTQEGLSVTMRITSEELQVYLAPIRIEQSKFRLMLPEERTAFLGRLTGWWRYDQKIKDQILKGKIVIKRPKN
jgi:gamma-polyglutamate biosynthesis protein CapA